jgi:hypothetical protein
MGRDEEPIDPRRRNREAEVVADEGPDRARVPVRGARHLVQPVDRLKRLFGIPRELGDTDVVADRNRTASAVLERLERRVDAEIRPADVPGPAATAGWNWSFGSASFTRIGADQVVPPSVDCENLTSNCAPSQSSHVT